MTHRQLLRFCREFRDGILDGHDSESMCFMISAPLAGLLNASGVQCEVEKVDLGECEHFFIRLPDGRVIDPTADQFNELFSYDMPPVYIGYATTIQGGELQPPRKRMTATRGRKGGGDEAV